MKFEDGEVVEVTDRQFYVKAAIAAYAKYAALQRRIDNIERRELQRCLGNSSLASQALKTNEEHWFYRELVNDRRVVNERFYPVRFKMLYKTGAMRRLHNKKMPHMGIRIGGKRRRHHQRVRNLAAVPTSNLPPVRVVAVQISKLYSKACCLQLVDAAVRATEVVNVLACRAIVSKQAHALGQRSVVSSYATGIAHRAKVLGRIEAETGGITERPSIP